MAVLSPDRRQWHRKWAGVAAVGQILGRSRQLDLDPVPQQHLERPGHVGAGHELPEAMVRAAAEAKVNFPVRPDVEPRRTARRRVGPGRMDHDMHGLALAHLDPVELEILQGLARAPGRGRARSDDLFYRLRHMIGMRAKPCPLVGMVGKKRHRETKLGAGGIDAAEYRNDDQIHAARTLVESIRLVFPDIVVMGHKQVPGASTECPGRGINGLFT